MLATGWVDASLAVAGASRRRLQVGLAGLLLCALLLSGAARAVAETPLPGPEVFGAPAGFQWQAISSDGNHVWVASSAELGHRAVGVHRRAHPGRIGPRLGLNGTWAISSDGTHVWVTNADNTVTELLASTGALVRVISGSSYHFNGPWAISSDGTHVWVANEAGDSVSGVLRVHGRVHPGHLGFRHAVRDLVGRYARVGPQLVGQLGYGAVGVDRRARAGDLGGELSL